MSEHYFSNTEAADETEISWREVTIRGHLYRIALAPKVFSAQHLDLATQVLLDFVPPAQGRCLDIGCGWGPITLALAQDISEDEWQSPDEEKLMASQVVAVDVNPRAIQLTRKNLEANHLGKTVVEQADTIWEQCREKQISFDTIWSNPPVRIGKSELHNLLAKWLPLLSENGVAYLVIGNNLGAKSLLKWLQEQGWEAQKAKSKKGFSVLKVQKAHS